MNYHQFASSVATDYEIFTLALRGAYLTALMPGTGRTPRAKVELIAAGMRLGTHFMQQAELRADDFVQALTDGPPSESIATRKAYFLAVLRIMTTESVRQAAQQYATGALSIGSLLTQDAGAMGQLVAQNATDTSGRTWRAARLLAVVSRDFAYQAHIDNEVARLGQQGDLVRVVYADPAHANNGLVLSLSGAGGVESFAARRDALFHPNASAELRHVPT